MEKIYTFYQSLENEALINFQVCGITYPDKNYKVTRNNSGTACIEFVESGSGVICTEGRKLAVNAGDAYFLHEHHNQHYYANPDEPWKKYWVNLSGRLLDNLESGFKLKDEFHFKGLDIKKELVDIINITKRNPSDNTELLIGILTSIFYKMYISINADKTNPICNTMRDYIDFRAYDVFNMKELCDFVSLSESQTIRVFKQAFNKTPYAYFLEKKLGIAKNLLVTTNLSVKQIAQELKFADQYYFSTFFKEKTGLSPKQYRNR